MSTISPKIYNWFTEGFGTADLKDAKALASIGNDVAGMLNMAIPKARPSHGS
jgi:hypothetical protein